MFDPADCNVSATEATTAKIREKTEATAAKVREGAETTVRAARQFRGRLQEGWRQASSRVNETRARLPVYKEQLRANADHLAKQARYYHETRPLNTLGAVVAAAFLLGIGIGFGRR